MNSKVSVIGAGNVGATCAQRLVEKGYADVVLLDIVEGLPQGKALDILQSTPLLGTGKSIFGSNNYEDTAGSDVVVITSGVARKPGMSRDDLVLQNMAIVKGVTEKIVRQSPECVIILVTNPLDAMTYLALKVSKFERNRVIGQSGILDTIRFQTFIAKELNVSVKDVSALILGGHGDTMVALPRLCTVGGVPLSDLLQEQKIEKIIQRTVKGGGEIVELLKTGSAFYAPAAATVEMVDAILLGRNRVLPCAVYLQGEYGINDSVVGVPVILGEKGVEKIIEMNLTTEETAALRKSAAAVKEVIEIMKF
ncbi:MAG: malate dehydrogenase [Dehalococcoidia bacterium]|nr:malate dehydrogenase [Dehalococcoidia bacterium]MDZ4246215.1 malate dehydrogenase [Dehalococcoidia bacterium]